MQSHVFSQQLLILHDIQGYLGFTLYVPLRLHGLPGW